jgi:hypothetical protein
MMTGHGGSPEYGVQARGAVLAVRNFGADQEGASGVGTTKALVSCAPGDDPAPGSCRIDGLGESVCGPDSVMVELGEGYKARPSFADIRNLSSMIGARRRALVWAANNWTVAGDVKAGDVARPSPPVTAANQA